MVRLLQGKCVSLEQWAFNDFQTMAIGDATECSGEDNNAGATLHNAILSQR